MRSGCLPCKIPHGMPAQCAVRAADTSESDPRVSLILREGEIHLPFLKIDIPKHKRNA